MDVTPRTTEPSTRLMFLLEAKKINNGTSIKCFVGDYKIILPICLDLKICYLEKAQCSKGMGNLLFGSLTRILFTAF